MQATIRPATPADAEGIAHVHVASWRTTYRGILPDSLLAGLSVERRAAFWGEILGRAERPGVILVADHPVKSIIGFASAGPPQEPLAGYDAELHAIYLLEAHQRGGLGRALVRAAAEALLTRGHQTMFLWVFAENESRRFYEALVGQVLHTGQEEFGGVTKEKIAYGWPDLAALAGRAAG